MNTTSHPLSKTHHSLPSGTFKIQYFRAEACESNEFPITDPWESYLVSESHPINTMLSTRELEVGFCHSGSGILVVEGKVIPFKAGSVSVVGNGAVRMSRSHVGTRSLWSWIFIDHHRLLAGMPDGRELLAQDPFSSPDFPYIFPQQEYPRMCETVHRIMDELKSRRYAYRAEVKGLASAFIASLLRTCQNMKPGSDSEQHPNIDRLAPVLTYMANNYSEPIDIEDLAAQCNLSQTHFYRVFKTAFGQTPRQYLTQLRISMAMALLSHSYESISQVAFAVGFESINTFNRSFRKAVGTAPRNWRRNH